MWLTFLLACSSDPSSPAPGSSPPTPEPPSGTGWAGTGHTATALTTGETSDTGALPTLTGGCTLAADHGLRVVCDLQRLPEGPIRLVLSRDGIEEQQLDDAAGTHTLWGLAAGEAYTWTATDPDDPSEALSGSLAPHAGPVVAVPTVTGTLDGADAILTQVGCGDTERLIVVDGDGALRWYADPEAQRPGTEKIRGYGLTDTGTVLAIYDNEQWVELGFEGEVHQQVERGTTHGRPFHHDLVRAHGLTYVLDAREVAHGAGTVVYDGFTVYDAGGIEVASWSAEGHLQPEDGSPCCGNYWKNDFPDALDFAHSNAMAVDDDGFVYLSYRYIDTIHKIVGDPADPAFGQVVWSLVGRTDSSVPTDWVLDDPLTGDPTFGSPHHVQPIAGGIRLYDNGWSPARSTRILELDLDEGAGTATVSTSVSLGLHCPIQGSAVLLPDGSWLTVCSGDDKVFTVDPATGERGWELALTCPDGSEPRPPYRGLPVTLP